MGSVAVRCNAKINLYLRVLAARQDGFHNIETVYHSISLSDTVRITPADTGLSVVCDDEGVPADERNLALRAARGLLEGTDLRVRIEIAKRIPMGAGLGGGSADAAGALIGIDRLLNLGRSPGRLERLARALGADVTFMLGGGCAVGLGRGDQITPLEALPPVPVVLVIPPISVSTGWAYGSLKMGLTTDSDRLSMVTSALGKGDITSLCDLLHNDFEGLIFDTFPIVGQIKQDLLTWGARGALMSGSGPVTYGLFTEEGDAKACGDRFHEKGLTAIVCGLAGHGVTVIHEEP